MHAGYPHQQAPRSTKKEARTEAAPHALKAKLQLSKCGRCLIWAGETCRFITLAATGVFFCR